AGDSGPTNVSPREGGSMVKHRVLLADADEVLLGSYRHFLSRHGYTVATATSGLECVAQLRQFKPEAVVLDPDLPWGGGEGVMALMYEERDIPVVPVMILAAPDKADDPDPLGVFPASGYLVKPVAPADLAENLRHLFRRRRAKAQWDGKRDILESSI